MRRWPLVALTLAVLWLFVRGVDLTLRNVAQELLIGLVLGFAVAALFRRLFSGRMDLGRALRATPYVALYFVVFVWDLVTANVDVAARVLAPSMPIDPDVVEIPLRVETPFAITTIANSITLTPGTLTMDYDDDTNTLFVHAMNAPDRDAIIDPIRRWEEYALVIFDEERKPGDPVPEPRSDGDPESGGESDE
ncbi:Na+/H+ antiporter subunit E [Halobacterium zhouii]|uniref:Na+/H+ antiporter subunit E n=1 Tax=Halobacterium zhouii TaxID=2902624 RepID=UPI001E51F5FB|nr:Na+/H+ antiporter subunit E [Halobacterium zhouii]